MDVCDATVERHFVVGTVLFKIRRCDGGQSSCAGWDGLEQSCPTNPAHSHSITSKGYIPEGEGRGVHVPSAYPLSFWGNSPM